LLLRRLGVELRLGYSVVVVVIVVVVVVVVVILMSPPPPADRAVAFSPERRNDQVENVEM